MSGQADWRIALDFASAVQIVRDNWSKRGSLPGSAQMQITVQQGASDTKAPFWAWRALFGEDKVVFLGQDTDQVARIERDAVEKIWQVEHSGYVSELCFETASGLITITLSGSCVPDNRLH